MSTATVPQPQPSKALHIGAWIAQVLLAAAFGMAGLMKLGTPSEELVAQGMTWINDAPAFLPKFIGASEVAGAVGLILPSALRILPKLTPLAAAGLLVVMVLASLLHLSLGEFAAIGANAVLGGLAAFVLWVRIRKAPIAPRQ